MTAFEHAMEFVLSQEGGFVDDPADHGGATKYGISHTAYPDLDIAALTLDEARAIYRRDYWNPLRLDEMPEALAMLAFDAAVNMGKTAAARQLQAALGVKQDGVVGPVTVGAANGAALGDLMIELAARRMNAYGLIPQFAHYGLGWSRRLMRCFRLAMEQ